MAYETDPRGAAIEFRKHLGWYTEALHGGLAFRRLMNACETTDAQLAAVNDYFDALAQRDERLDYSTQPWAGEALAA